MIDPGVYHGRASLPAGYSIFEIYKDSLYVFTLGGKLEGETDLVRSLVELLDVGLEAQAEGHARAESLAVGEGGDALVVELSLHERRGVKSVLDGGLQADVAGSRRGVVPGSARTDLGGHVNAVVDRRGVQGEVVRSGNDRTVGRRNVAEVVRVAGDLAAADVVAELTTGDEALVAEHDVTSEGRLEHISNNVGIHTRVLEVEAELSGLGASLRQEGRINGAVETRGERILHLNLGVEHVRREPALRERDTGGTVGVLGLELAGELVVLLVRLALHGKGDAVGRNGAHLKAQRRKVEEVLAKDVVRLLGNVFEGRDRHGTVEW